MGLWVGCLCFGKLLVVGLWVGDLWFVVGSLGWVVFVLKEGFVGVVWVVWVVFVRVVVWYFGLFVDC